MSPNLVTQNCLMACMIKSTIQIATFYFYLRSLLIYQSKAALDTPHLAEKHLPETGRLGLKKRLDAPSCRLPPGRWKTGSNMASLNCSKLKTLNYSSYLQWKRCICVLMVTYEPHDAWIMCTLLQGRLTDGRTKQNDDHIVGRNLKPYYISLHLSLKLKLTLDFALLVCEGEEPG